MRLRVITTRFESQSLHTNSISVLEWSPSGTLLLTGDGKGQVGLWNVAASGKLSLAQDYKRPSGITQSTFGPDSSSDAGGIEQPFFYVSTTANEILMGCTGPLQLVATEEASVECLLFDKYVLHFVVLFSPSLLPLWLALPPISKQASPKSSSRRPHQHQRFSTLLAAQSLVLVSGPGVKCALCCAPNPKKTKTQIGHK
jgi:WD40 repeat protein